MRPANMSIDIDEVEQRQNNCIITIDNLIKTIALLTLNCLNCKNINKYGHNDHYHRHRPYYYQPFGPNFHRSILLFIIKFILITPLTSSATSRTSMNEISETMLGPSNLSCFVCTTIDDINCKYLNETINKYYHHHHQIDGDRRTNGDLLPIDPYSHHLYMIDGQYTSNMYASSSMSGEPEQNPKIDINLINEFRADCLPEEQYCVVIRLGVSAPDNVQEFNFFALKRGCAEQCTDGCFIIGNGEKTKLSICATCCTSNYCNLGNMAIVRNRPNRPLIIVSLTLAIIVSYLFTLLPSRNGRRGYFSSRNFLKSIRQPG